MAKLTDSQRRAILAVIAEWDPRGTSIELLAEDRQNIREDITILLAPALGIEAEAALSRMDALRMAGGPQNG